MEKGGEGVGVGAPGVDSVIYVHCRDKISLNKLFIFSARETMSGRFIPVLKNAHVRDTGGGGVLRIAKARDICEVR